MGDRAGDRAQHFWPSPLVTAIAESPGTAEEEGRADLQQQIGNGKDPPICDIPAPRVGLGRSRTKRTAPLTLFAEIASERHLRQSYQQGHRARPLPPFPGFAMFQPFAHKSSDGVRPWKTN